MRSPIQVAPVLRCISTASNHAGIQPSDTVTKQNCENRALSKYCFWGQKAAGCDATGSPYITCKA